MFNNYQSHDFYFQEIIISNKHKYLFDHSITINYVIYLVRKERNVSFYTKTREKENFWEVSLERAVPSSRAYVTIMRAKICICQKYNYQNENTGSESCELATMKNSGRDDGGDGDP